MKPQVIATGVPADFGRYGHGLLRNQQPGKWIATMPAAKPTGEFA